MRIVILCWLLGALIVLSLGSPLAGQSTPPQNAPPAQNSPPPQQQPPKAVQRDDSSGTFAYILGGTGVIAVLILVCMPARRE